MAVGVPGTMHLVQAPRGDTPVLVCLLGGFRLLAHGRMLAVRSGGKTEAFLTQLALAGLHGMSRDRLLSAVWPHSDPPLAAQALNSLVHTLRVKLVDVSQFQRLAAEAECLEDEGRPKDAVELYSRAIELYVGDLSSAAAGSHAALQRERLRASYRHILIRMADSAFARDDYRACLEYALELLEHDPCREDAHRLVMRCRIRLGERSEAMRHYQTARIILRTELDTGPEPATIALFEQIRSNAGAV